MSGSRGTGTNIPHGVNLPDSGLYFNEVNVKPARIVEAAIAYTDSGKALFTIPDGAKLYSCTILATTGFNGTTPTYNVGYAADTDAVVSGVTLPATAGFVSGGVNPPTATAAQWNGVTSGKLIGTFSGGGSNTTGAGIIRLVYYI